MFCFLFFPFGGDENGHCLWSEKKARCVIETVGSLLKNWVSVQDMFCSFQGTVVLLAGFHLLAGRKQSHCSFRSVKNIYLVKGFFAVTD